MGLVPRESIHERGLGQTVGPLGAAAAVLAATSKQIGPVWMAKKAPRPRHGLNRVGRAGHRSVNEHEAQAALSVEAICQQFARDDVDLCGDELQRDRHTPVIHYGPPRLRCVEQLQLGARPYHAGPSACALSRAWLCSELLPPHHLPPREPFPPSSEGVVRDEPGYSKDPLLLEALVNLTTAQSTNLQASRSSCRTTLFHAAYGDVENLAPRCPRSSRTRILVVSHHCAKRDNQRRGSSNTREKAASSTTHDWLAGRPARIQPRCFLPVSKLPADRLAVAFASDTHRVRSSSQKCGQATATDNFDDLTELRSPWRRQYRQHSVWLASKRATSERL